LARKFFTFQFAEKAIESRFGKHSQEIMEAFVRMLIFDAIVGNNDRHFYNWGVVTDLHGKKPPIFAPVYDTARGLFWHFSEQKVNNQYRNQTALNKYIVNSKPKTGWQGEPDINHFQLVELIYQNDRRYRQLCRNLLKMESFGKIVSLMETEFSHLLSPERFAIIKDCLELRFQRFDEICK
jgi:hypothetical protein